MKKFAFRLETVLQHRAGIEEAERAKLSKLQLRLQSDARELERLEAQLAASLDELGRKEREGAESREIAWYQLFADRMRHEITALRKAIEHTRADIVRQQTVVVEATRATKVLDTLKTKQSRAHRALADRLEQKAVDEIVVTRFGKERPAGPAGPSGKRNWR